LSEVRVAWSLFFCAVFCKSLFVFFSFGHCTVLSVLLRFMDSDYPFGIFKLFLWEGMVCLISSKISLHWYSLLSHHRLYLIKKITDNYNKKEVVWKIFITQ
jgi:hypothetical protein